MQEAFAFQKVNTPPVCFCAEGLNTSDKLFLMLSRVAAVNEGKRNKSKVREKTKEMRHPERGGVEKREEEDGLFPGVRLSSTRSCGADSLVCCVDDMFSLLPFPFTRY